MAVHCLDGFDCFSFTKLLRHQPLQEPGVFVDSAAAAADAAAGAAPLGASGAEQAAAVAAAETKT